jgi:hypothetical protein
LAQSNERIGIFQLFAVILSYLASAGQVPQLSEPVQISRRSGARGWQKGSIYAAPPALPATAPSAALAKQPQLKHLRISFAPEIDHTALLLIKFIDIMACSKHAVKGDLSPLSQLTKGHFVTVPPNF